MRDYNSSKAVVKLGYSEDYDTRNLEFRVKCNTKEEFLECVDLIGSYNEFNRKAIDKILRIAKEVIGDLDIIDYTIGREGSPVVYMSLNTWDTENRLGLLQNKLETMNKDEYIADEIHLEGGEIRLWFD